MKTLRLIVCLMRVKGECVEDLSQASIDSRWSEILGLQRKFVGIELRFLVKDDANILKCVWTHKRTLTTLEMSQCKLSPQLFMNVLHEMENLENLVMRNCTYSVAMDHLPAVLDTMEVKNLPMLKSVKLIETLGLVTERGVFSALADFYKLLSASQITSFELEPPFQLGEHGVLDKALDFLAGQKKLESLTLISKSQSVRMQVLLQSDFNAKFAETCANFRLRKFIYRGDFTPHFTPSNDESFIAFIRHNASTLEEIEIHQKLTENMLQFMINTARGLKKLGLNVRHLSTARNFYDDLHPSETIDELTLVGDCLDIASLQRFLEFFTNVTTLKVEFSHSQLLNFIGGRFKKLRELSVSTSRPSYLPRHLIFPELRELCIQRLDDEFDFKLLFSNCPKIERLVINKMCTEAITEIAVKSITHAPNMLHIKIQGQITAIRAFGNCVRAVGWHRVENMELLVEGSDRKITSNFYNLKNSKQQLVLKIH